MIKVEFHEQKEQGLIAIFDDNTKDVAVFEMNASGYAEMVRRGIKTKLQEFVEPGRMPGQMTCTFHDAVVFTGNFLQAPPYINNSFLHFVNKEVFKSFYEIT